MDASLGDGKDAYITKSFDNMRAEHGGVVSYLYLESLAATVMLRNPVHATW